MGSYLYELPTTGAISFSEFLHDQGASYISDISDTTEARANLRAALKESKRTGDSEKDYLKLVKVRVVFAECYLSWTTLRGVRPRPVAEISDLHVCV